MSTDLRPGLREAIRFLDERFAVSPYPPTTQRVVLDWLRERLAELEEEARTAPAETFPRPAPPASDPTGTELNPWDWPIFDDWSDDF